MNIQPINTVQRTNFKGLFIDKSVENKGNWKMEYHPYSWEINPNTKNFGNAHQTEWDIYANDLPDNEKRFTPKGKDCRYPSQEYCTDILRTKFYLTDHYTGSIRRHITDAEAMNLEESLIVKNKKLNAFLQEKDLKKNELKKSIEDISTEIDDSHRAFLSCSRDYNEDIFDRINSKKSNKYNMDKYHTEVYELSEKMHDNTNKYTKLMDSKDAVKTIIENNNEQLALIKLAKDNKALIDISRRDIYDPNKLLYDALQNLKTASKKIIALPHRVISVEEVLSCIKGKIKSADIPMEAIKIVDKVIAHRL